MKYTWKSIPKVGRRCVGIKSNGQWKFAKAGNCGGLRGLRGLAGRKRRRARRR